MGRGILQAADEKHRKVHAAVVLCALVYVVLLWIAAWLDMKAVSAAAMWVFGLIVLPYFYFKPSTLAFLSLAEWFNKRDNPNKWDTLTAGLLLYVIIIAAAGLSMIMGAIGAGGVFPVIIPFIVMILVALKIAGVGHTRFSMSALAVVTGLLMLGITLTAIPAAYWLRLGIARPAILSGPSNVERQESAIYEGAKENAQRQAIQCMRPFKGKIERGEGLTQEERGAVARCSRIADVPVSEKEGAASQHTNGPIEQRLRGLWDEFLQFKVTDPTWFWVSVGAGAYALYRVVKGLLPGERKATAASNSGSSSSGFLPAWIIWLCLAGGAYSIVAAIKPPEPKEFPKAFLSPGDGMRKSAYVVQPPNHPLYGRALSFNIGQHPSSNSMQRFVDYLNGGYENQLVIMTEQEPYLIGNSVCNAPKIHSDGKLYVVCTGNWSKGQREGGTYSMMYNEDVRRISLTSPRETVVMEIR